MSLGLTKLTSLLIALVLTTFLILMLHLPAKWFKRHVPGSATGPPIGTIFVLLIYIIFLTGMWGATYWLLVIR